MLVRKVKGCDLLKSKSKELREHVYAGTLGNGRQDQALP